MTFVLVDQQQDQRSDADAARSAVCRYRPTTAFSAAAALKWISYADALADARSLLAASSHEELRLLPHQLSNTLTAAFFYQSSARPAPMVAGGVRFPEGGLYVSVDLPPLGPALLDVQRPLIQVSIRDADHGSCDWYFDTVRHLMWRLRGGRRRGGRPRGMWRLRGVRP